MLVVADFVDALPFLIPLAAIMIPIVAILTNHQRKMAELVHSQRQQLPAPELESLRREVQELKQIVHQQTIAIDNISRKQLTAEATGDRFSGV